jgi:HAD superfamily hydrolase (TIGR01509 family)
VFDMDGVLVDSEHLWAELWEQYANQHGVGWSPQNTTDVQGMSAPEWAAYLTEHVDAEHDPSETERAVVDGMIKAIADGRAPLLPGAKELLSDVSAHAPVGLATSAPRRVIDAVLSTYGIAACFAGTVSSSEVDRGKPGPDVYLEAAARIGVGPGDCLAVEDSTNGVQAAASAGMTVIAVPSSRYPLRSPAVSAAFKITEDLDQVRQILWEQLGLTDGGGP